MRNQMPADTHQPLWWQPGAKLPSSDPRDFQHALRQVAQPLYIVKQEDHWAVAQDGMILSANRATTSQPDAFPLQAHLPPLHPQDLGDPYFKQRHGLRYAYVIGAMANGITSVEMVSQAGQAGLIGFFGSAGLLPPVVEAAIDRLQAVPGPIPFGFNLIHSPHEPDLEAAIVDLYLRRGVRLVSASAYMDLTDALIYFRFKGIHHDSQGRVVCPNKVIAKVSRVEVGRKFFSPPPDKQLRRLVEKKMLTSEEASLAACFPVADDLTAEADSGGHTDNRPALSLLPIMLALRDEMMGKHQYQEPLCVGLAGGIATPESTAAAYTMGAAYVLTGSINQACLESGTSSKVRQMLAETRQADVTMAPAADMFELGVKVQVLKRGTMFPLRAAKLYEFYRHHEQWDSIPQKQRETLERDILRSSFQEAWEQTKNFFYERDPKQIERAEKNPHHKMALVFRSYLGRSSNWANSGDESRVIDYQIWCGPSMGAFNAWVKGSFLETPANRSVVLVALNLLMGASVVTRCHWLRCQSVSLPINSMRYLPMDFKTVSAYMAGTPVPR